MSASFWETERICLVAGCGFVGSHLVDALVDAGARVRVANRTRPPHRTHPRLEHILADLTRPEDCARAVEGAEFILHAAGTVGAAGVGSHAAMLGINLNLTLTANLLEASWRAGVRRALIFGSSTAYPEARHPVREDELWNGPVAPGYLGYGWMRRYIEKLAAYVTRESGMGIAIVRPGALYGPRDNFDPATGHVVSSLLRRAVESDAPLEVWGTGEDVRDFLHIRDFARGCLLALEHRADCDPVNLASGTGVSTADLARLVLAAAGRPATRLRFDPARPTVLGYRVLDISKARAELGFAPQISLANGLKETADWYRSQLTEQAAP